MKVFVTGVCGQLGHDVVKELLKRGYNAVGSDIQPHYSGVQDVAVNAPYVSLDITNAEAVDRTIKQCMPDAVIHCAA